MKAPYNALAKAQAVDKEAERVANFLCSVVAANTTVTTAVLRALLLKYDGRLTCRGELREVKNKRVGPGVYRVWTEHLEG